MCTGGSQKRIDGPHSMKYSIKSVSIRMEEEMLKKLNYVADYEGRSLNSHILVLIRNNIKAFEAENGNIEGSISPDFNVKPGRHK